MYPPTLARPLHDIFHTNYNFSVSNVRKLSPLSYSQVNGFNLRTSIVLRVLRFLMGFPANFSDISQTGTAQDPHARDLQSR